MTAEALLDSPVALDATDALVQQRIEAACAQACSQIAPTWPLDRAIAVNPHWQRTGQPVRRVAARLALLAGLQVFPPRRRQLRAWEAGRITLADLQQALDSLPAAREAGLTPPLCVHALQQALPVARLPLLMDVLDTDPQRHTRLSWRDAITHQVSQVCAAFFDEHQADWQPQREQGLYAFWRDTLQHDHGIGMLMGLPRLGWSVAALPPSREAAERWALQRLALPEAAWADYLEAVLLTVQGWAAWCAWRGWQAGLEGRRDGTLRELLALRLAWGALLLDGQDDAPAQRAFTALRAAWAEAPQRLQAAEDALLVDEVWQAALEVGWQRNLARRLAAAPGHEPAPHEVRAQAVFCIDVRSEPLRRALEAVAPDVQTVGFAGFFGLGAAYTPLGSTAARPQLPGLLAPALELADHIVPARSPGAGDERVQAAATAVDGRAQAAATAARQRRFTWAGQWGGTTRWPGAAFSTVESIGVGHVGSLFSWWRSGTGARPRDDLADLPARYRPVCRPLLTGLPLPQRVALAADVLRSMGLTTHLAPLVLLVGHGSHTRNNAHAAALDCGACGGQTGESNVRALAALLNDPAVREGLSQQGLAVPAHTTFVAALHNTTTDEIEPFDLDRLSATAQAQWAALQPAFEQACDQARRERAPHLGLDPRQSAPALLTRLRRRANDGAQTRPEWGLAGNAALLLAPRRRSRGVVLQGRAFLHDYDSTGDPDGALLERLMTAPMLVAHWINWQYHASTCEPQRLGSGNKLLHNVVGGHIGVFEGNGGDLRIGLSRQALHDGQRWVHEPLRLTVVIDAPAAAIDRVIDRHDAVRHLVEGGWLHLWRFEGAGLQRRTGPGWEALPG